MKEEFRFEEIWYEKFCRLARRIIPLKKVSFLEKNLKQKIEFCELRIHPEDILSATVLSIILSIVFLSVLFILKIDLLIILFFLFFFLFIVYFIFKFVDFYAKYVRIRSGMDLVLSVLYMVISLRLEPNLERALVFAASNVGGPVGRSLKRTAWYMKVGKYITAEEALSSFSKKWSVENEELATSLDMIKTSLNQPIEERDKLYEESLSILLERNKERLKEYTRELKSSVNLITYLGILLPLMLLTLFPIVTIFLRETIRPSILFVLFDGGLPLMLFILILWVLNKRPLTFGEIELEGSLKKLRIGYRGNIPLLPFSIIVGISIISLGVYFIGKLPKDTITIYNILYGLLIVAGMISTVVIFSFFSYVGRLEMKRKVRKTEEEFTEALFSLGNILKIGHSFESSLERLTFKIKDLEISKMFNDVLGLIRKFNFTLERAFFDKKYGVIKYYPSKLIRNIARAMVESLKKGPIIGSDALIGISKYLKTFFEVESHLKEILEDITSQMKFILEYLTPIAVGVTIAVSSIASTIVLQISKIFKVFETFQKELPLSSTIPPFFGSPKSLVKPEIFIIVMGIYVIEISVLLSYLYSSLIYGEDKLEMLRILTMNLIRSFIIFTFISILTFQAISGMIPYVEF